MLAIAFSFDAVRRDLVPAGVPVATKLSAPAGVRRRVSRSS